MARGPIFARVATSCPICGQPCRKLNDRRRWTVTCGQEPCRRAQIGRRMKGSANLGKAVAAARQQRDARMQAVVQFNFGPLSERERQLFTFVWKYAWQRGYMKALRRIARQETAA